MKRYILTFLTVLGAQFAMAQYTPSSYTVSTSYKTVAANELSVAAGSYDRIEMVRNIQDNVYTVFAVPAVVDGYFFGADAERYLVNRVETDTKGFKTVYVKEMDDLDDFEAGKLYMVKPEKGLGTDTLYSYTAGVKTQVKSAPQTDLVCWPLLLQDVTRDKKVDVVDVTATVDIILGKAVVGDANNYDHNVADMNGDGKIDVNDITLLVNAILTGSYNKIVVE